MIRKVILGLSLTFLLFAPKASAWGLPNTFEIINLINIERAAIGLDKLTLDTSLSKAAELKVIDLVDRGVFEHTKSSGKNPWWPLEEAGFDYKKVGENLALEIPGDPFDFGTPFDNAGIVKQWMDSPSHRKNLLDPDFSKIGIASSLGTYEGDKAYFLVQYGASPKPTLTLSQENQNIVLTTKSIEEQKKAILEEILKLLSQLIKAQTNIN